MGEIEERGEGKREKDEVKERERKKIFVFGFSSFQNPNIYSSRFFETKFRFYVFLTVNFDF